MGERTVAQHEMYGFNLYEWEDKSGYSIIYDFGNHEKFFSVHQIFLQPNRLYFVLFDLSRENVVSENRICYWLHLLHNKTGGSIHLKLVGTKADLVKGGKKAVQEKIFELKSFLNKWCREECFSFKFDTEKDIYFVSNNKSLMNGHFQLEELMGEVYDGKNVNPITFTTTHKKILTLSRKRGKLDKLLSLKELLSFAKKEKIFLEIDELEQILTDLSNLGTLLFIPDDEALLKFAMTDIKVSCSLFSQKKTFFF